MLLIIGAKGVGKTDVCNIFTEYGFVSVHNEEKYLKYGQLYPNKDINSDEEVQDKIYAEVEWELANLVERNIIYEATGTNKRWQKLKDKLLSEKQQCYTIKIVCPMDIALCRLKQRDWSNNYPATIEHILDIEKKIGAVSCDFVIDNSGTKENTRAQIIDILRRIGE